MMLFLKVIGNLGWCVRSNGSKAYFLRRDKLEKNLKGPFLKKYTISSVNSVCKI